MKWQELFHVVAKDSGKFIIVRNGEGWSYNMRSYDDKAHAHSAASHIYRAIQRKIEKELLG